jgi:hypothetical protein
MTDEVKEQRTRALARYMLESILNLGEREGDQAPGRVRGQKRG